MKSRTLMALAVAGTFACAGAFAGGMHHGSHMSSTEVQTPASVDESSPWLTGKPHLAGWGGNTHEIAATIGFQEGQFSDGPIGTSAAASATGSGGYQSMSQHSDLSMSNAQTIDSGDSVTIVEYWLLDAAPSATGASSSAGGSGSVGFDSSMSDETTDSVPVDSSSMNDSGTPDFTAMSDNGLDRYPFDSAESTFEPLAVVYTASAEQIADTIGEATPLLSEHYLIHGPLSQADGQSVIVLGIGPASQDVALLDSLSRDFYVLTPAYDEG